ncbi:MAG: hypothetical protein EBV07_00705 [Proteobacteria bacterium]|nr:hypothetical protein [Pseudomonadota bacterium]
MATTPTFKEDSAYQVFKGLSGGNTIGNVLPKVEQFVYFLGIGFCIVFIILAAYQYFLGEDEKSSRNVSNAQTSLTYAFIGFGLLLILRVIFMILANVLGYNFDPSLITKPSN